MTDYSATTTNATNTITATPEDDSATVSIMLNGSTAVTNGTPATWQDGANTLVITVQNGAAEMRYTVEVSKSA